MKKLENVAWISGATSGIGRAAAIYLAQKGFAVSIIGRRVEEGQKTFDLITNSGGHAIAIKCDVAMEQQVKQSIDETAKAFGKINVLINNSGMVDVKNSHNYETSEWDMVMDVNLKSMYFSFKYAYKYLRKNNRSYIVNIGSISSFVGQRNTPVYTTSKHAVLGLTRSIALDYAEEGMRCNCICPGITETPMLRKHLETLQNPEKALRDRLKRVPLNRALKSEEIAKAIYFFCSENSSGITGTSLTIDGGYLTAAEWEAY